jgi:hypothetical protein
MLQLSLLATAMGHYTWLRSASERLSQFSRRPVCTGLKKIKGLEKMKGLASHPWAVYSANWPVTQMDACVGRGGMYTLPLPPRVPMLE